MARRARILPALLLPLVLLHAEDFKDRKKGPRHVNPELGYSVVAPSPEWKEMKVKIAGADVVYMSPTSAALMVLSVPMDEDTKLSDVIDGMVAAQKAFTKDIKEVSREDIRILGEPALRVVLENALGGLHIRYDYHVVRHGGNGYFLVGYGSPELMKGAGPDIDAFVSSFRFLGPQEQRASSKELKPWAVHCGESTVSVRLDPSWTEDKFEGQPEDSIWIRCGAGRSHFQLLVEETSQDAETYAAEAERLTASVVKGYSTVATGEAEVAGEKWKRIEGKGSWANIPARLFDATCLHGSLGVRACLYWPEAKAADGREALATILATVKIEVAERADIGLPDKSAQRRAPDAEAHRDLKSAELVYSLPSGDQMEAFAPAPDGERLALSKESVLQVIDVATKALRLVPEGAGSSRIAWTADGQRLWFVAADGTIHSWDAKTSRVAAVAGHAVSVAFAKDRLLLIAQVDQARPDLGWDVTGPQRLVSCAQDGSDERVLFATRLAPLILCGVDARTGDALAIDRDAGALRHGGWRLVRIAADGKSAEAASSSTGSLSSAAWTSDGGVLCEVTTQGADEEGGGRAFLLDPATGKRNPLSLPQHYSSIAIDAKDRVWFCCWWHPDGSYGPALYRMPLAQAKKAAPQDAHGVSLDNEGLRALDTKLVSLLPAQPGPAQVSTEALSKAAALAAEALGPHVEGGLSYQDDSLERLAALVSSHPSLFAAHPRSLMAAGAYAAEVLRRSLSAEWVPSDGQLELRSQASAEDSPIVCVANPLAEFWSLAYSDEGDYGRVKSWREWLHGRKLLLALSPSAAEKAVDAAEGPSLVASRKAWDAGDSEGALRALGRAMSEHPKSLMLRMQGFQKAYAASRTDLASKWAQEATEIDPRYAEAWSARGVLALPNDPERAIEWLRKALDLQPAEAGNYLRLGYAYAAKKDAKAALACFARVGRDSRYGAEARRQIDALRKNGK